MISPKRTRLTRALLPLWQRGSIRWLVAKEMAYGGIVKNVRVGKISPHDTRSPERLELGRTVGVMVGGDRMSPYAHNYAAQYSKYLKRFLNRHPITLVEIGILKGTGLAIWSDLFPNGEIIGLDIDLGHFHENRANLERLGAFSTNNIQVHEFDQYACTPDTFRTILRGRKIDIYIDDGMHEDAPIINAFRAVLPHLKEDCVCFLEDNDTVSMHMKAEAPDFDIDSSGHMTVLNRNRQVVTDAALNK